MDCAMWVISIPSVRHTSQYHCSPCCQSGINSTLIQGSVYSLVGTPKEIKGSQQSAQLGNPLKVNPMALLPSMQLPPNGVDPLESLLSQVLPPQYPDLPHTPFSIGPQWRLPPLFTDAPWFTMLRLTNFRLYNRQTVGNGSEPHITWSDCIKCVFVGRYFRCSFIGT